MVILRFLTALGISIASIVLIINDLKDKTVPIWAVLLLSACITVYGVLLQTSVPELNFVFAFAYSNIILRAILGLTLLVALVTKRSSWADVLVLLTTVVFMPIQAMLYIIVCSSAMGLLWSFVTRTKEVPFLAFLSFSILGILVLYA